MQAKKIIKKKNIGVFILKNEVKLIIKDITPKPTDKVVIEIKFE